MADVSPTLAREDGRKFGAHIAATILERAIRASGGRVASEQEKTTIAVIEASIKDALFEKHLAKWSSKSMELFRKQFWRVIEKRLNELRREYRRG